MEKVIGTSSYGVIVKCPSCAHYFDACSEQEEVGEFSIQKAMFLNTLDSCTDMGIVCVCPICEGEFILDSLEY